MKIILASSSPRRRELLAGAGRDFTTLTPHVDETRLNGEDAETFVKRVARDKALAVEAALEPGSDAHGLCVISGDTAVVLDGKVLGKPSDADEARAMLSALSGRSHEVLTGMCMRLTRSGIVLDERIFTVSTGVVFKTLTDREIDRYIASGEPFDKAGAYGIQSGAAYMVRALRGSYTNVVGMPLTDVVETLDAFEAEVN